MNKRRQNHWGWGFADHFGDAEQRAALAQMAESMLGLTPGPVREPIPIEEVELAASAVQPPPALTSFVTADETERIFHTYGRSFPEIWRGFHGAFDGAPDLVARPHDESELRQLMEWAEEQSIAVVPYGGGTSVVGGVTPEHLDERFAGWVSVDMGKFNAIGDIDAVNRTVRIGAGASGPTIEDALQEHGLTLRHYPQSFEFSTLGGWLATRAGGHFATNYTRIDHLVESIRLVAPSGVWSTPEVPSTGAGPAPKNLVLGSEGILGFITSAVMKVRPRPVYRSKAQVQFANMENAAEACRKIAQAYLFPANCRLLDKHEAMLNGVVNTPSHVLLLGFESAEKPVSELLENTLEIAVDAGGQCPDGPKHRDSANDHSSDAAGRWREAFFEAPYLQSRLLSVGIVADTFETAITWSRFDDFHRDLKQTLHEAMDHHGGGRLTLRFTHVYPDGPAPYYTFIFSPEHEDTLDAWRTVRFAAADVIARHNATITHHHAVGRLHRPWYENERSPLFLDVLRAIKDEVDPRGVLNPGVLLASK